MPPAMTVDIKIEFEQTDMIPGPAGRIFRRNCLMHGGKTDAAGYSYADTLLRQGASCSIRLKSTTDICVGC